MQTPYTPSSGPAQGQRPAQVSAWYVRVDDAVYGPFSDAALHGFMVEGRVTPNSFVSRHPSRDFRQLATIPGLMAWMQTPAKAHASPQTARVCLVMAEIRSGQSMAFLQALQALGETHRIGDTLWLLKTSASPADAVGVLSPPLAHEDRLFVVDASMSERAAFNLGQAVDAKLRDIFDA